jgi:hypothetical protein
MLLALALTGEASSLPTVLQGEALWRKWRSLLQDVFFWFEYLYEESAGMLLVANWHWSDSD